jgi:hypothetical protein
MPQAQAAGIAVISPNMLNEADTDLSSAPSNAIKTVITSRFAVQVDNGWVIYQGSNAQGVGLLPIVKNYVLNASGGYVLGSTEKVNLLGTGLVGQGAFFSVNGVVFAPCAIAPKTKCAATQTAPGIGLGFGQATFGAGSAVGGWVNKNNGTAQMTNLNSNPGSIAAVATDLTNGAYAVGWDLSATSLTGHAIVMTLDSAGQTYKVTAKTDLGTLGGATSQALSISRNAKYIVGIADAASGNAHAVYALGGDNAWTDLTAGFPAEVLNSRALVASNNGLIAGSASVKRLIGGKLKSVDLGFVYNTNDSTVKFFEAPGASVIPLKVFDNGQVVGNLEFVDTGSGSGASPQAIHPFLYNGTDITDFSTMVLASTGQPAFGCRANRPNNLGELVGSCIKDDSVGYGASGTAFYLNAFSASPAFIDVNAAIHASSDASTPAIKKYSIGTASSIDDQHEITVMGLQIKGTAGKVAAFLASKATYNQ